MTDSSENIKNKYAYDSYGKNIGGAETITNPFKYVGMFGVMDEGNDLYYMRARYYDAEMKRFINKDPYKGSKRQPLSLNRYAYVEGNPINYIDPSGRIVITGGLLVAAATKAFIITAVTTGTLIGGQWIWDNILEPLLEEPDSSCPDGIKREHDKINPEKDTHDKHTGTDSGDPEKGDARRTPPRKRPKDWRGPWPPK